MYFQWAVWLGSYGCGCSSSPLEKLLPPFRTSVSHGWSTTVSLDDNFMPLSSLKSHPLWCCPRAVILVCCEPRPPYLQWSADVKGRVKAASLQLWVHPASRRAKCKTFANLVTKETRSSLPSFLGTETKLTVRIGSGSSPEQEKWIGQSQV